MYIFGILLDVDQPAWSLRVLSLRIRDFDVKAEWRIRYGFHGFVRRFLIYDLSDSGKEELIEPNCGKKRFLYVLVYCLYKAF
jgi:hypothetical protein